MTKSTSTKYIQGLKQQTILSTTQCLKTK